MDQKMQNFSENRETIVPITFVNGNIKATEELNSMFTLPYDLAVLGRATTLDGVNNIAQSEEIAQNESFKMFCMDVARMDKNNFEDAIKVYLLMNCRDFIYTFILNMMNNICGGTAKFDRYDEEDDEYYYDRQVYINDRDIDKLVLDHLNTFVFALSRNRDMVNVYYYQLMNSLYFQVVAHIDGVIRNTAYRNYTGNHRNKAFSKLVAKVYGENNGIDPKSFTPEFRYTFATSIIREMVEKELPILYQGLHRIFMSAAGMACTSSIPNGREEIFGAAQHQIPEHSECICGGNCNCEEQSNQTIPPIPKTVKGGKRK